VTALAGSKAPARRTVPAGRLMRAGWRRYKITITAVAAVYVACALVLFTEAFTIRADADAHHLSRCWSNAGYVSSCDSNRAWNALLNRPYEIHWIGYLLLLVPGIVAVFGGVRWLTREYDTGVGHYSWTQSVSRTRWFAGTGMTLLAIAVVAAAVCGWAFNWWYPAALPFSYVTTVGAWDVNSFPLDPIGFVGLTLVAFAAAALAAALIRRTLPAMVVTVAGYAGILVSADNWLRPQLLGLGTTTAHAPGGVYFASASWPAPGVYPVRVWFTSASGRGYTLDKIWGILSNPNTNPGRWLTAHHFTYWVSYQPVSHLRMIRLEWSAILVLLALAMFALAAWRVRSR
jgi:hypothetical protein